VDGRTDAEQSPTLILLEKRRWAYAKMNEILTQQVRLEMERVLATGKPQCAGPPRYARVGIPFVEGVHEVKECGGENKVTSMVDDSGMGMAHGGEGEHQVEECGGEDRAISTADDFGKGAARWKEVVGMKNVVATI
jgi:hypothetical protein